MISTVLFFVAVLALAAPLGTFVAKVLDGRVTWLSPVERFAYRLAGIRPTDEMTWKQYAGALLFFNLLGALAVYAIQRTQQLLPLNPAQFGAVSPEVAFNTAVSFASNTNWQAYSGETSLSHLTQMLALTTQNFVSAATGIAVLAVLMRGFVRVNSSALGNFWADLTRVTLYVLLPLSVALALFLISQGVVQTFAGTLNVAWLEGGSHLASVGPVASQVAIKQLGTNGGGFFNVNSAHPFENPTGLSNFAEVIAIILIPVALCFSFGAWVKDARQGRALLAAMLVVFLPVLGLTIWSELHANPLLAALGVEGPNFEGKEVRFGPVASALWAATTTAASNGSVNAMHDSLLPLGGLGPMWLMQLGEVIFGGVGSGLYGLVLYALVAVFIAGLMVGRTPEYLGKKIEAKEMKLALLAILLPSAAVLVGTALASMTSAGTSVLGNPGAHGFSEILYAFSSGANNNGSAFGGLTASGVFYATAIGVCMLVGRYWVLVPVLAIAGSLAARKAVPTTAGTLPTHTPLFVGLLVGTLVLIGALTFLPSLVLGPIVEHLELFR